MTPSTAARGLAVCRMPTYESATAWCACASAQCERELRGVCARCATIGCRRASAKEATEE